MEEFGQDEDTCSFLWKTFHNVDREVKKRIRKNKKSYGLKFISMIEEMSNSGQAKTLKKILKGKKEVETSAYTGVKVEDIAKHFQNNFQHQKVVNLIEKTESDPKIFSMSPKGLAGLYFNSSQIEQYISELPSHKAPGQTGITAELLQHNKIEIAKVLEIYFLRILEFRKTPKSWKQVVIIPIPKGKTRNEVENYRPISLTEIFRKIFEKGIHEYLKKNTELSIFQGGFREKRSTLDQALTLDALLKQATKERKTLYVCFLDIKAAYDSVPRQILWKKLNYDEPILQMLKSLFDNNTSIVKMRSEVSRKITHHAGLLQGSLISPILYSAFMNDLPEILSKEFEGIKIEGLNVNNLMYADDIALIANSPETLHKMLKFCETHANDNAYLFNASKTKVLYKGTKNTETFGIEGRSIERVKIFKYLGLNFNVCGLEKREYLEGKAAECRNVTNYLITCGMRGSGFNSKTKLNLYKTFVRPKIEYGLAIMNLNKTDIAIIQKTQYHALCGMMSVGRNTGADMLHYLIPVEESRVRVEKLQAKYKLRVDRMNDDFLVHRVLKMYDRKPNLSNRMAYLKQNRMYNAIESLEIQSYANISKVFENFKEKSFNALVERLEMNKGVAYLFHKKYNKFHPILKYRGLFLWYARKVVGQAKPCLKCSEMNSTSHMMKCSSIVYNKWLKDLSIDKFSIERKIEDLLLKKNLKWNALRSLDLAVKKMISEIIGKY